MVQIGKDLPLHSEPAQHFVRVCATFEHFDCDTLLKFPVGTFGEIHGAHTAASEFLDNYICPEPLSDAAVFVLCQTSCSKLCELLKHGGILGKQFFSLVEEC
jgi:hypothetical protein